MEMAQISGLSAWLAMGAWESAQDVSPQVGQRRGVLRCVGNGDRACLYQSSDTEGEGVGKARERAEDADLSFIYPFRCGVCSNLPQQFRTPAHGGRLTAENPLVGCGGAQQVVWLQGSS